MLDVDAMEPDIRDEPDLEGNIKSGRPQQVFLLTWLPEAPPAIKKTV